MSTESVEPINILEMSDEAFSELLPSEMEAHIERAEAAYESEQETSSESIDDTSDESEEEEQETLEDVSTEGLEEGDAVSEEESDEGLESDQASETEQETPGTPTPEELVAELFSPFKANNQDMQVDTVEDARRLMQMGANYNKKMSVLKPNLKFIKMLEKNGLLSEDKISYLIDISKNNPAAIKKLVKDSGMDDIELSTEEEYEKNTYTVDDAEIELDGILSEIKDTESFDQTIDVISNKWDASSKQTAVESPGLIKIINEHITNGIYGKIQKVVDRERMLGKLDNVSDIDAYMQVGKILNKAGAFNSKSVTKESPTKQVSNKAEIQKKKAASTNRNTLQGRQKSNVDLYSMTDAEVAKLDINSI